MPQLITIGNKLFRVNRIKNCLEYSANGGAIWVGLSGMPKRFGQLKDILYFHDQIFAATDYGILASRNQGADWGGRGTSSIAKSIVALEDGGNCLIGLSDDGHVYASLNEGADWGRRG